MDRLPDTNIFKRSPSRTMVRQTKTQRAGITFSVTRVHRQIRKGRYAKRIRIGAAVYAAVVLEYLVAEILELAGKEAAENNRMRITPRHIMFAIRKDGELDALLKNVTLSNSGVVPHVHSFLLNVRNKVNPNERECIE